MTREETLTLVLLISLAILVLGLLKGNRIGNDKIPPFGMMRLPSDELKDLRDYLELKLLPKKVKKKKRKRK